MIRPGYGRCWVLGALVAVALAGCEEQGGSGSQASSAENPDQQVIAAWKEAGIEVSDFAAMAGAGIANGTCRAGQVARMDTVICHYADDAAAKAARPAGLTYIGETTGVALYKGPRLLVIADRNKADPSGKTINQIAKGFLGSGEADKPAEAAGGEAGDKAGADKGADDSAGSGK